MRHMLFVFVILFASTAHAVPMFIIAGQSNAAGQAPSAGLNSSQQKDVLYYRFDSDNASGTSVSGKIPLSGTIGPEFQIANALAERLTSEIAIVKVAMSGTPLAVSSGLDWNPASTNELYSRLVTTVNTARSDLARMGRSGRSTELAAVFWMQGEQDAKSGNLGGGSAPPPQPSTANNYQANLTTFIQSLRSDLGAPNLPFFIGQINIGDSPSIVTRPDSPYNTPFGEWDNTPTIQAAQLAVASAVPNSYLVPTVGFTQLTDYLHFDTLGQIALGNAFASRFLEVVPEPSSLPMLIGLALANLLRRCKQRFSIPQL